VRIGLVCPYTWDTPGGVQAHVHDLAENLIARGHEVSVLAPVDEPDAAGLPDYLVPAGRAVPVPYNGSVARICFGPLSLARTRRWLRTGRFDVLHLHEPNVMSVSMLAIWAAKGPMVATFHLSRQTRSLAITASSWILQTGLEKLTGRIAVSPAARKVVMEHLGGDAVLIPNGVSVARFAGATPLPGRRDRPTVVFLGRVDEPRKGLAVLLEAVPLLVERIPDVQVLVAGPGDVDLDPTLTPYVEVLGLVSEADKPRVYASGHVYCAPNTHGESFGIVLTEAMATGTPVVASDLEAFRRVLEDGTAGVLFPNGDSRALAACLADLLADEARRDALSRAGRAAVAAYDWATVTDRIEGVYETVRESAPVVDAYEDEVDAEDEVGLGEEGIAPGPWGTAWRRFADSVRSRV
jgi:phosphatidylinositol alpha-mannosyltransferase